MMLLNRRQADELVEVMTGVAKRLVVVSSCDVYLQYGLLLGTESGPASRARQTEDSPLRSRLYPYRARVEDRSHALYDYDKIAVERAVMSGSGLPATVLRLPMVYGPNDYQHRFLSCIRRMADQRPGVILDRTRADWRATRGYVENCAHAITLAITDQRAAGRIYNVGEEQALSEREWINQIASLMNWSGRIVTLPDGKMPDLLREHLRWDNDLDIDTSRIREDLGYTEPVAFEEGLRRTIEWELSQRSSELHDDEVYAAEDELLLDQS
jgi:nucleoside-diphosphate-sugar epimerase